ncbi:hypothetical protein T4D_13899 [Trichinella pseudospiralis]|uniref:Uncharacterized protein n=1 Tax=Trichinella pseudospiralis TaxID=6337 RepID=A0A0V1FPS1_TRIPS|nr:hypothetical protein T4D_13899 [Trichinella pseudospiralis]
MLFIRARCSLCQTAPATWRSSRTPLEFSDYCFASLPDGPTMSKATRLACPTPVLNVFPLFGPVIPLAHVRQGFCHAYVASPRLIVGGLTSKSLVSPVSGVSHTRHMIPSRWTIRPGWAQRLFIKRLSIGASFGQASFMIHYRSSASFRYTPKMPSNPDEGLHLPPLIGAAPLWARERATGVDHRKALFTRLRQHRSDDVLAGVDVHHKGSADVSSTVLGPSSSSHAAGTPHTDKVPDEPSVVGRKSQKLPVEMNFRTVLGHDVPCVSYALVH